jgi:hypothetical protein
MYNRLIEHYRQLKITIPNLQTRWGVRLKVKNKLGLQFNSSKWTKNKMGFLLFLPKPPNENHYNQKNGRTAYTWIKKQKKTLKRKFKPFKTYQGKIETKFSSHHIITIKVTFIIIVFLLKWKVMNFKTINLLARPRKRKCSGQKKEGTILTNIQDWYSHNKNYLGLFHQVKQGKAHGGMHNQVLNLLWSP